MRNIIITFILTLCAATTLPAQFVQGTLQGGPPAPGTKSRSPLNSLERAASNRYGATIMTDSFGNQRFTFYVSIWDTCITYNPETAPVVGGPISVFVKKCATDSIWYIDYKSDVFFMGLASGGGPVENWYTVDDTTTDATRTAYILENAEWIGEDPGGYINFRMGDVSTSDLYVTAINGYIVHNDLSGESRIEVNTTGVDISTSNTASRSVDIATDTMNWIGAFDPTKMRINFLSDHTYMYADSAKIVAIGQFPNFPSVASDGTEKGFLYNPLTDGVSIFNGNGISGANTRMLIDESTTYILTYRDPPQTVYGDAQFSYDYTQLYNAYNSMGVYNYIIATYNGNNPYSSALTEVSNGGDGEGSTYIAATSKKDSAGITDIWNVVMTGVPVDQEFYIPSVFLGKNTDFATGSLSYSSRYAWGVQHRISGADSAHFNFINIYLDEGASQNSINFYGEQYQWLNGTPSGVVGDTSFHYWAGNGTDTDPGFMTLDQVCAHCAADAVNWYNSNGTTTENTRVATVTETATWLSTDGQIDGVFPFRFELEDGEPNEPEMMVWLFPNGDSLALQQSDVEIQFHTNTDLSSWADGIYSMRADSVYFTSNIAGGTGWKVTDNQIQNNAQRITQTLGTNAKQDVIETVTITGTAQTELTMPTTGSVLNLVSNSAGNFEIHITAVCSAAGNGVGISTGEAWASWHVGGIKNIGGTTALVGTVQTTATAQSDAGMSTSVVTVDDNNTNDSLRIRFTPPSTAGTTTVIKVIATIEFTQTSY